jgi:aspartate kinase
MALRDTSAVSAGGIRAATEATASTVVMKFGGTSVADAERIKRAARMIVAQRESGKRVVAVLSARGKTTDDLIAMAQEVSPNPERREMDMLLSTGERIACALCAMAINDLGHHAISLTGSQAGIVTDASHTKARILDVRADRIREALEEDRIVLVAGFQGVSTSNDVTTLGRGGSDTTAVALAAAMDADVGEIYTDVSGVYSADPRIVSNARLLPFVSFEEMLEMAASGARVLQLRAVEYARSHGVRIHCRSSFDPAQGTVVLSEEETMERPLITAVTHATDEARITLLGVPDRPGAAAAIFGALADAGCNVDTIIQNEPLQEGRNAEVSFTIPQEDLLAAEEALEPIRSELGIAEVDTDRGIGKVAIVGAGMRSHPGVAAEVFRTLAGEGINIEMISTSPIKISCVIRAEAVPQAVQALHSVFALGAGAIEPDKGPR